MHCHWEAVPDLSPAAKVRGRSNLGGGVESYSRCFRPSSPSPAWSSPPRLAMTDGGAMSFPVSGGPPAACCAFNDIGHGASSQDRHCEAVPDLRLPPRFAAIPIRVVVGGSSRCFHPPQVASSPSPAWSSHRSSQRRTAVRGHARYLAAPCRLPKLAIANAGLRPHPRG